MAKEYIEREALLHKIRWASSAEEAVMSVRRIPAADVVSKGLYEQIKWERDVALAQLEEYGVSLGEKVDVAEVIRCKDCKWYSELACGEGELLGSQGWCNEVMARPMPSNGFCSFGERENNG